ncbi:hypothetical protein ERJ75_000851200 [Trypanosoma vivax]|nr:hypothetical protein ERJ75_000851200 [Trypanosoma vivax]
MKCMERRVVHARRVRKRCAILVRRNVKVGVGLLERRGPTRGTDIEEPRKCESDDPIDELPKSTSRLDKAVAPTCRAAASRHRWELKQDQRVCCAIHPDRLRARKAAFLTGGPRAL